MRSTRGRRRLHRHGQRRRHRLGAGRRHGECRHRRREDNQHPPLPHHKGDQERRGPAPDQDAAGLAASGARRKELRMGTALRALHVHDGTGRPIARHGRAWRILPRAAGRRVHRRRGQRRILERLDRRARRPRTDILRIERHAHARGRVERRASGGLLPQHPRRRPDHGRFGKDDRRDDRQNRGK